MVGGNKLSYPLGTLQAKIRRLRQHLRGSDGLRTLENKRLLDKLDELDKLAEVRCLSSDELNLKHCLREKLMCLLK